MKILFLSHAFYPAIGGIETHSEILARAFQDENNEVHLLTWTVNQTEDSFPFKVIRNPSKFKILKEVLWCDIVYENNPSLQLSWLNLIIRKPQVTGLHVWLTKVNGKRGIKEVLKKRILNSSDKIIACSKALQSSIKEEAIVIGNPYNSDLFRRKPELTKTKDWIFLGRLVSDKGVTIAIKAFQLFLENNLESCSMLTIVGDGEEKKNLIAEVTKVGLEDKIIFLGSKRGEELVDILNQHKFLLVPSIWDEPFGIVALEGMGCGCIPIVSDGGGLPDAVGNAGLLFEKGNVSSLLTSMQKIYDSPSYCDELRFNAIQHLDNHNTKKIVKEYLSVFHKITGK